MGSALVVQNRRLEGPGLLGELLAADGFGVDRVCAWRGGLPGRADHDMMVVLGAPESANDALPYLRDEQALILDYMARGRPVLGICLGSQLIARALGARVYRGAKREVGFYSDLEAAGDAGLFSGIGSPFTAFHWHGETFGLPEGATRLVGSREYENQAFICGTAVGLQFHLEADGQMVREWLDAAAGDPGIAHGEIRSQIDEYMPAVRSIMERFYRNFVAGFGM